MNAAGIPWKNYQEDIQLAASPTNSASGTNGPVNPYNGTTQYNYAVKHNPMAFFADTALQNVYPLAQLFEDLNNNTVGRYNWITPDQYNEAHSALNGGFTYHRHPLHRRPVCHRGRGQLPLDCHPANHGFQSLPEQRRHCPLVG